MSKSQLTITGNIDTSGMVFVFGSNEAGRHGAGAALYALNEKGAVRGKGLGHYGKSYAIPTKDSRIVTLPLRVIQHYVDTFVMYAQMHPELTFQVTCIGCGLAGLKDTDIAPMFKDAPANCYFDTQWQKLLHNKKFWGTF